MELRHLRYFVAVAEELHFGRAAARLHIAQPALSVQIRVLEERLGGRLLARTQRQVALTEAGERLLPEARATLAQAERAANQTRLALRGELGTVTIGFTGSVAYAGLLARVLKDYRVRVPGVSLQLEEIDPLGQIARLSAHTIDVGLLNTLAMQVPDTIDTVPLVSWPLWVAVGSDHRLAGHKRVSANELRAEPFVRYSVTHGGDQSQALRDILGFDPVISHRGSNLLMVLALVGAGLGVALVPSSVAPLADQSGVRMLPFGDVDIQLNCAAAFRVNETDPAVQLFLTHLRERVASR